jgi:hypothetical protein
MSELVGERLGRRGCSKVFIAAANPMESGAAYVSLVIVTEVLECVFTPVPEVDRATGWPRIDRRIVHLLEPESYMTFHDELIAVSTFSSVAAAEIAKGILDEVGIRSIIRSDNAGGMYPALDSADLLVRAEDAEKATAALHRWHRR